MTKLVNAKVDKSRMSLNKKKTKLLTQLMPKNRKYETQKTKIRIIECAYRTVIILKKVSQNTRRILAK